jgi:hypothetical protein
MTGTHIYFWEVKARPSTQRNGGSRGLERDRPRDAEQGEKQNPTTRKCRRSWEERPKKNRRAEQ